MTRGPKFTDVVTEQETLFTWGLIPHLAGSQTYEYIKLFKSINYFYIEYTHAITIMEK